MLESPPVPGDFIIETATEDAFAILLANDVYYPKPQEPQGQVLRALVMGLLYACIDTLGPDHLGTLVTLSTVAQPVKAFRIGAAWGFGHTFGMALVGLVILLLRHCVPFDTVSWEHYGQYVIGFSMMACGVYFLYHEASFLQEEDDGSLSFANPDKEDPLAEQSEPWLGRDVKGAIVGLLQGLCCPMVAIGISFMASLHPIGIAVFLLAFILMSSLLTASLAVAWAAATARGLGGLLSPQAAYRASCGFTVGLGLVWILANGCGFIAQLDYSESLTKLA